MATKSKKYKRYMCGTDFDTELHYGAPQVETYESVRALKNRKSCWRECGIIQVEIKMTKQIRKGTKTW